METVTFRHQTVPAFIAHGNHAAFIRPFAETVCRGRGLDIGCGRKEWALPGAVPIDAAFPDGFDAFNLPEGSWDYVFSSHCLEHLGDYEAALRIWISALKPGGVLFLYLPHPDCLYWQPNEMPTGRHRHTFTPLTVREMLASLGLVNLFWSERDLAYSFAVFGERP